ncbi:DoxX family protein [Arenimonas terrae]|uniref:DoxX family protein n=1 Tax=Arenimonas terrae TaxID=2546226 RepID=A0A5C4RVT0_9GAMM|nr:DoxX family protein [Arenimonas terrae]TNJ35012.1 DoxX family protein [Arenimonas terrae]
MNNLSNLVGRFGLSAIFVLSGVAKLGAGYEGTQGYMEAMGVSGGLLPVVIAAEILGGLAVAAGFLTRWAALGLAVFSVLSAFLFHFQLADQMQFINFFKNIAIAGGFLVLAAHGAGRFSIDGLIAARRAKGGA